MYGIMNAPSLTTALNDRSQSRVVNVTDIGKEVVFNLKIQASQEPGQHLAFLREIDGGLDLVHGPIYFRSTILKR